MFAGNPELLAASSRTSLIAPNERGLLFQRKKKYIQPEIKRRTGTQCTNIIGRFPVYLYNVKYNKWIKLLQWTLAHVTAGYLHLLFFSPKLFHSMLFFIKWMSTKTNKQTTPWNDDLKMSNIYLPVGFKTHEKHRTRMKFRTVVPSSWFNKQTNKQTNT